jgi:hypothetical protein
MQTDSPDYPLHSGVILAFKKIPIFFAFAVKTKKRLLKAS